MSNVAKGNSYEDFVETVYKAILEAELRQGKSAPVNIEKKKKIISKSGTPSEIDIYWEHQIAGITHKVAIECKNYNVNIDISRVRDFARKIEHISGLKGLMVTKKGFTANAIAEASADNIDLLIIRSHTNKDWDGYIKEVVVRIHILSPSRAIKIKPVIDIPWALENGFKTGDKIDTSVRNDLLIIEDEATGFKHTLLELEENDFFEEKEFGIHSWRKELQNGWGYFDQLKLKLLSIEVEYEKPEPTQQEINIDFEDYVLAVMEYINGRKEKLVVLTTGETKNY